MVKEKGKAVKEPTGVEPDEVEDEDWREILTDQYKFEKEGDGIQGVLLSRETSSFGVGAYTIQIDEDHALSILGTTTLDRQMVQVRIGEEVRIAFTGKTKTGSGRFVKLFSVQHRKAKGELAGIAAAIEAEQGALPF